MGRAAHSAHWRCQASRLHACPSCRTLCPAARVTSEGQCSHRNAAGQWRWGAALGRPHGRPHGRRWGALSRRRGAPRRRRGTPRRGRARGTPWRRAQLADPGDRGSQRGSPGVALREPGRVGLQAGRQLLRRPRGGLLPGQGGLRRKEERVDDQPAAARRLRAGQDYDHHHGRRRAWRRAGEARGVGQHVQALRRCAGRRRGPPAGCRQHAAAAGPASLPAWLSRPHQESSA